MLQSFIV